MDASFLPICAAAAAAGIFHAFLAGHWLPFVLAARAHRWKLGRVTTFAAVSSLIHIGVTIGIGIVAVLVGQGIAHFSAHTIHALSAWLLLAAAVVLGGMALAGYDPFHRHAHEAEEHEHGEECGTREGWALAVVLGLHPNAAALTVLLAASTESVVKSLAAAAVFAVAALGGMVVAVAIGMQGVRHLPGGGEGRGGRLATAVALAAMGLWILLAD